MTSMYFSFNDNVYNKVSELVSLKLKSQLKNSGIEFDEIFLITNLVNKECYYLLIINKDLSIKFSDKKSFLDSFIKFLKINLKNLEIEFEELTKIQNQRYIDKYQLFEDFDMNGHLQFKQTKLLEKMIIFLGNIK